MVQRAGTMVQPSGDSGFGFCAQCQTVVAHFDIRFAFGADQFSVAVSDFSDLAAANPTWRIS